MFSSNRKKQKRFDRTNHKQHPNWEKMAKNHRRLYVLALLCTGLGSGLSLMAFWNTPWFADIFTWSDALLWAIFGGGIPFIIFMPVATFRHKSNVHACKSVATGRYDDMLDFQKQKIVYTYSNLNGRAFMAQRHEQTMPYDLIDRIVYKENRGVLEITAGGVDTTLSISGTVLNRMNYCTGRGYVNPFPRTVTIPLTYQDNDAVIRAFASIPGVQIEHENAFVEEMRRVGE